MQHEAGDDYLRRISTFIRTHEKNLAEAGAPPRRRRSRAPGKQPAADQQSVFNPLGWFASAGSDTNNGPRPKPIVLSFDVHHLSYILIRLEALGINVGTLDVRVDSPSRPLNYINIFPQGTDKSDALSMASFRSSLSAVSALSLGSGWFSRQEPPSVDQELKYIYSSFTKLPALSVTAPGPKVVAELASEPPNENALPLDAFKNLESLECLDIDPRALLGWDRLADSLRSLTIKRSGLEDVSDVFIGAVTDDQERRQESTNRARRKVSRQSFHSTQLPETVPEDNEESQSPTTEKGQPSHPPPGPIPAYKWGQLRHLSLADNALTFLPSEPLQYLTSLTHLDLSSNLLVSVPPGLSGLYNLVSLDLSDNMIDSVLGIYTQLGQVLTLNLAQNRLESLCGLERLRALERVDLRLNHIDDVDEIGRLAALPNIADVSVDGNPLTEDDTYRLTCFEHFWREGRSVKLDGSEPGFYERRGLSARPPSQMSSSRSAPVHSPPVVAVGAHHRPEHSQPQHNLSPERSPPSSVAGSPAQAAVGAGKGRRRKNKRIVTLEAEGELSDASGSHSRIASDAPSRHPRGLSKRELSPPGKSQLATQSTSAAAEDAKATEPVATTAVGRRSRHARHHTEHAPAPTVASSPPKDRHGPLRGTGSLRGRNGSRRTRASASVFEPEAERAAGSTNPTAAGEREAEAYRRRIEALRADMGDGWLKVLAQSQVGSPGVASG